MYNQIKAHLKIMVQELAMVRLYNCLLQETEGSYNEIFWSCKKFASAVE